MADPITTAVDDYLAQPSFDKATIPLLKNTMANAVTVKPDFEAELQRASQATGVPIQSARGDPEYIKGRAATLAMDIDGLVARSPSTADFLGQGDNAKLAHDDIGVLESTEHYLKRVGLPAGTPVLQAAPATKPSAGALLHGLFNSTGLDMTNASMQMMLGDALGWTDKHLGYNTAYGWQPLFSRDTSAAQRDFRMAKGRSDRLTPEINDPTLRGVYGAGQSIVQTAPAIGVSVLVKNPYPALAVMGAQSGLGQYGEVRARGGSAGEATAAGVLTGGIEAGTELLPMGFIVNKFGKKGALAFLGGLLAREVPGEQLATVAQDAVDTAIANPDKTWADYLAERPEAAYQTLVATVVQAGLMEGASASMHAAVSRATRQEQAAVESERTAAGVGAIMQMAEASKLRERAPATFHDFVAQAAEGGPVENIYVDADTLAQSVNTPETAALLAAAPEVAQALQEAQVSGQDVKIPVETFATVFAGTPVYEALKDHLKTSPDGMTRTQAQDYMATQSESLRADFERVMAEKEADDGFKASAEAVTAGVQAQLATANRFTPDVNEKYAALTGQFYAVQAARLGVTPEEMFARYPLRVDAGNGQTLGVLDQSSQGSVSRDALAAEGNDQAVAAQPLMDSASRDAEEIANIFEGYSGGTQSDSSGGVPALQSVFAKVRRVALVKPKVLDTIVELVPVDVVDRFFGSKRAAKVALHNEPMFKDGNAVDAELPIAGAGEAPSPVALFLGEVARLATEGSLPAIARSEAAKSSAAALTGQGDGLNQGGTSQSRATFNPRTSTISLLRTADLSSYLHELGHFQLEVLTDLAGQPDAPAEIVDDVNTLLDWFGIGTGGEPATPRAAPGSVRFYHGGLPDESHDGPLWFTRSKQDGEGWASRSPAMRLWYVDVPESVLREERFGDAAGDLPNGIVPLSRLELPADLAGRRKVYKEPSRASLIDWHAMTLDEKRPYHEQFARGFEAYLFEGKAPSLKLRGIFQRFRAWMLNVYRELANLNVELQPDVRQVMDRMLATSEEIKVAEDSRVFAPLFSSKPAEMTDEEWVNYQNLGAKATQDAISELETRSLRDMRWLENTKDRILRGLQKEAREKRKAVKAEVVAEVSAEPVNRARQYLKRGLTEGSDTPVEGPHKLSTKAVGELYADLPEELQDWKRLGFGRYGMLAEDGVHPDVLADLLGYPSGAALVEDLLTAESYNDKVAGMTDQRMLERYGDLTDEDAMGRAADEAIHNDARLRFVATELNALEKAIGGRRVLAAAARQFAEELVQRLKIRDLRTAPYTSAETRAARAADKALKGGDLIGAATQKRNQLINGHAARAVFNAKGEVAKSMALFKRIISAKDESTSRNRNMDLVNAARAVLAQYGIGAAKNTPDHYMGLLKAYDPGLHADLEPYLAAAQASAAPIREITLEQFQGLRDTVAQLWELSRRAKVIEIDGKAVEIDAVTAELGNRLDVLGVPLERPGEEEEVTKAQRFMRGLSGLRAAARRVESWARTIDGADQGPFRKYLWQPISEAADRYRIDKSVYLKRYLDIVKTVEETLKPSKIAPIAGGIRYTFSGRAELLHALLHTGNESNKRKLLLGRSWGKLTAEGELDDSLWQATVNGYIANGVLTKTDFDFAQAVWDLLDETKAVAQKAHRTVYGRYFNEVTADSFETPWGTYRGGYVPALTDSFLVQDAAVRAEQDAIDASNATMFPSPAKGFTQGRVEDYTRELALDLRLLPQHIDKVLKFTHLAPPVRDAMRVLKARGFAAKLERFDPVAQTDLLLPWLNRAAKQVVETPSSGAAGKMADQFFRTLRQRTGMGVMFANITNALQQLTGFSVSAVRVKPKHLRNALWQFIRNPAASAGSVQALSQFMTSRTTGQVFETQQAIDALLLNPNKYEKARAFTQQHAYFLQSAFQNLVDNVTWMGAYAQAQDQGQADKEAARFANSVVRETQGSLAAEDVSRYETGTPLFRLFTQFQSFFNGMANLMGTELGTTMRDLGLRKGAGRMAYVYLMGFMIPAVISEVIVQAMRGGLDDDDDDGYLDEILGLFFNSQLRFGTAMIPVGGPILQGVFNAANSKPYDDRISTGPAIAAIEASVKAPAEVYKAIAEGKGQKKAVRDSLTAITLLTGIPVSALGRPAGYLADVNEGKVKPTGPVDMTRGLVTGSASPGSKQ